MSLLTNILNLFKYEETDEGNFNINTALNENWDKIDSSIEGIKSKTDNISVTQEVDLDDMESDIDANATAISNSPNLTSGTAEPIGGSDGDIYFQYE